MSELEALKAAIAATFAEFDAALARIEAGR